MYPDHHSTTLAPTFGTDLRLVRSVQSGLVGGTKLIDGGVDLRHRGLRVGTNLVGLMDFLVQGVDDGLVFLANNVLVASDANVVDRLAQCLLVSDGRSIILAKVGVSGDLVNTSWRPRDRARRGPS